MERKIDTYDSAEEFLKDLEAKRLTGLFNDRNVLNIKDSIFNFDLEIPLSGKLGHASRTLTNNFNTSKQIFSNCTFNDKVKIVNSRRELLFDKKSCFTDSVQVTSRNTNLIFHNSKINNLDVSGSVFGKDANGSGKLRLKKCTVKNSNFKNATFHSLVDFYQTTFEEPVIFNKTDFLNVLVLSAAKFKSNMLFTYTLLNDKVIMRGTQFFKGFDISLAIIKGELALFDIQLDNKKYIAEQRELSEDDYEDFVANKGKIPISNKRETYRVLKKEFISNVDYIHSLKYKRFELETYDKILVNNINQNIDKWKSKFNRFILYLNRKSNNYGTRFENGIAFIFTVSLLFGLSTLVLTQSFWNHVCLGCSFDEAVFTKGFKFYINFLNPVHRIDYLDSLQPFYGVAYLFDFLGRIFIGYGVYQTIQAFRKYK